MVHCSKATVRSKSINTAGVLASMDTAVSLWTPNSADSVPWCDLKPDCNFSRTEFSCKKARRWIKTVFSKILGRKGR